MLVSGQIWEKRDDRTDLDQLGLPAVSEGWVLLLIPRVQRVTESGGEEDGQQDGGTETMAWGD